MDRTITLSSGTLLQPKRKFRLGSESDSFLECSDGSASYAFRENASVSFIEEEETVHHQLFELSKNRLLPKVIQFEHTNPQDILLKDNELKSALFAILGGPVEVKSFIDSEFILCRAKRNESGEDDEAVIIPSALWESIHVQRRCFLDDNAKEKYLTKNFWTTTCFDSVDKSLHIMNKNDNTVIWLRCPDLIHQTRLIGAENSPYERTFCEPVQLPVSVCCLFNKLIFQGPLLCPVFTNLAEMYFNLKLQMNSKLFHENSNDSSNTNSLNQIFYIHCGNSKEKYC